MIFIPSADLSCTASEATSITTIDMGFIQSGESKSTSFRIGNTSDSQVVFHLISELPITVSQDSFILSADEITDTITLTINVDLETPSQMQAATLECSTGDTLSVEWEVVGANSERYPQFPERSGSPSDIASNVISSLGDVLKVYRFDPIAYKSEDSIGLGKKFKVQPTGRKIAGYSVYKSLAWTTQNSLDPLNETYGYRMSTEVIRSQFTSESIEIETQLASNYSPLSFRIDATLIISAEFELLREWALFTPETSTDREQFKRTVFIVKRQGILYSIENIRTLDFGTSMSHFEADLVGVHNRDMQNTKYWNPWAVTYEYESDKPYAVFPFDSPDIYELISDSSNPSQQ